MEGDQSSMNVSFFNFALLQHRYVPPKAIIHCRHVGAGESDRANQILRGLRDSSRKNVKIRKFNFDSHSAWRGRAKRTAGQGRLDG